MNIFNTLPHAKAKGGAKASSNVLDVLGNHKQLTPEQVKALQKKGKLKADTGAFETLLKDTQKNPKNKKMAKGTPVQPQMVQTGKKATPHTVKTGKEAFPHMGIPQLDNQNQQIIKNAKGNKDILGQEAGVNVKTGMPQLAQANTKQVGQKVAPQVSEQGLKQVHQQVVPQGEKVVPQGETKIARVLKLGQSKNIKATQNNPNLGIDALAAKPEALVSDFQTHQALTNSAITNKSGAAKSTGKNTKLMDFKTFMMKQNPQTRSRMATQQSMYSNKNQSMFKTKIEDSLPGVAKKPTAQVKVQDMMLQQQSSENNGAGLEQQTNPQLAQVLGKSAPVAATASMAKVFDMNTMSAGQTNTEIITKIQDYAIQTKFSNEPQLDFSFKHNDLGTIDLTVQKAAGEQLNIMIGTNSVEGARFFNQNQGELLQTLTQAGVSVGDFKLEASNKSNNQNLSQNSDDARQNSQKEQQSEFGKRQEEQQKRAELWNQYKDKEAA